ncbi:hypothetical protein ACR5KS_03540 [Leucobacter sp. W1153]|uniref:hypothetical protein n=1 Tax=Leucobacter sp. W1153 TaxID=3439064 RepID=UPI003F368411
MSSIPQAADAHSRPFRLEGRLACVSVQLDDDYCEMYGIALEQRVLDTAGMLRVDSGEDVVFLSPAEALDLADALRAVAKLASQ